MCQPHFCILSAAWRLKALRRARADLSVCHSPPPGGVVLQLSATTLVNPSRDPGTTGAVQVEFFVNGMWSDPDQFIQGAAPGDTDAKVSNSSSRTHPLNTDLNRMRR